MIRLNGHSKPERLMESKISSDRFSALATLIEFNHAYAVFNQFKDSKFSLTLEEVEFYLERYSTTFSVQKLYNLVCTIESRYGSVFLAYLSSDFSIEEFSLAPSFVQNTDDNVSTQNEFSGTITRFTSCDS